jgi:hypothetical protein
VRVERHAIKRWILDGRRRERCEPLAFARLGLVRRGAVVDRAIGRLGLAIVFTLFGVRNRAEGAPSYMQYALAAVSWL